MIIAVCASRSCKQLLVACTVSRQKCVVRGFLTPCDTRKNEPFYYPLFFPRMYHIWVIQFSKKFLTPCSRKRNTYQNWSECTIYGTFEHGVKKSTPKQRNIQPFFWMTHIWYIGSQGVKAFICTTAIGESSFIRWENAEKVYFLPKPLCIFGFLHVCCGRKITVLGLFWEENWNSFVMVFQTLILELDHI